jgi:hypothetical protein
LVLGLHCPHEWLHSRFTILVRKIRTNPKSPQIADIKLILPTV